MRSYSNAKKGKRACPLGKRHPTGETLPTLGSREDSQYGHRLHNEHGRASPLMVLRQSQLLACGLVKKLSTSIEPRPPATELREQRHAKIPIRSSALGPGRCWLPRALAQHSHRRHMCSATPPAVSSAPATVAGPRWKRRGFPCRTQRPNHDVHMRIARTDARLCKPCRQPLSSACPKPASSPAFCNSDVSGAWPETRKIESNGTRSCCHGFFTQKALSRCWMRPAAEPSSSAGAVPSRRSAKLGKARPGMDRAHSREAYRPRAVVPQPKASVRTREPTLLTRIGSPKKAKSCTAARAASFGPRQKILRHAVGFPIRCHHFAGGAADSAAGEGRRAGDRVSGTWRRTSKACAADSTALTAMGCRTPRAAKVE